MTETLTFEPAGRAIPYGVEGAGPAVVLIAERGMNVAYLDALAHSLAQEDFRVLRIGSRRPADAAPSMADLAQDVVDVMDHVGITDAWVGGHGFGGSVARVVSTEHHDRVNGVLLLGVEAVPPSARIEAPEAWLDVDVHELQAAAWQVPGELSPITPVLVIQGTEDEVTPPAHGEALQASAPGLVSVVQVEGAGHLFPITHVGATSWAIEDYLDWD